MCNNRGLIQGCKYISNSLPLIFFILLSSSSTFFSNDSPSHDPLYHNSYIDNLDKCPPIGWEAYTGLITLYDIII